MVLDIKFSRIAEWLCRDIIYNQEIEIFKLKKLIDFYKKKVSNTENIQTIARQQRVITEQMDEIIKLESRITDSELDMTGYNNKETNVYVMIDHNTGYHKIGKSIKPIFRERTLQSEKPTIEMLFNRPSTHKDEKNLHKMFSEKRIRGEWFDLNDYDLELIKNYFK